VQGCRRGNREGAKWLCATFELGRADFCGARARSASPLDAFLYGGGSEELFRWLDETFRPRRTVLRVSIPAESK
jgi:hypothetical protein